MSVRSRATTPNTPFRTALRRSPVGGLTYSPEAEAVPVEADRTIRMPSSQAAMDELGGYSSGGDRSPSESSPIRSRSARLSRDEYVEPVEESSGWLWGIKFDATTIIWIVIIPIAIWIVLFSWKPNFVTDAVNGDRIINTSKLVIWTLILSIVVYAVLYFLLVW